MKLVLDMRNAKKGSGKRIAKCFAPYCFLFGLRDVMIDSIHSEISLVGSPKLVLSCAFVCEPFEFSKHRQKESDAHCLSFC